MCIRDIKDIEKQSDDEDEEEEKRRKSVVKKGPSNIDAINRQKVEKKEKYIK